MLIRVALRRARPRWEEDVEAVRGICEERRSVRDQSGRGRLPSERCSGRGGSRRSPPWAVSVQELLRAGRGGAENEVGRLVLRLHLRSSSANTACAWANVFHAGDGNLHPLVLYRRSTSEGEPCARTRGWPRRPPSPVWMPERSITGEHGIGSDKACSMPLMFGESDLEAMLRVRRAFDPAGLANPGKIFPTPRLCGEVPGPDPCSPTGEGRAVPSVFEPTSVREAADVLSTAASSGARVSLDRSGGDVVVSTKRLDRVLEHETGDLTCTVEAGVRLSALRSRLARHGQMLALDPPGDPTVGT